VQEQQATEMNTEEIDLGRTVVDPAEKRCEISMCGRRALLYICKDALHCACVSVTGGVNCSYEYLAG
jgi:hypothetical protein